MYLGAESSRSLLSCLVALCFVVSSLAEGYGYGAEGYGYAPAPVYYYDSMTRWEAGGYAPSTPTFYYSVPSPGGYEPSTPTYYYSVPSPGGYAPSTPTYYYSVPSPGGYEPTTPTYYYSDSTTRRVAPGGYAPSTPTYYYSVPSPGGYAPSTPTYYYSVPSPGGYAPSIPTYYYSVPSPGGYGYAPAPVYYYSDSTTRRVAPAGGYAPSTPTYYYSVPSPGGYAPSTPTYYYTAPQPSTCPPCPVCSAAPTAAKMASFAAKPDMGTCYCPYDHDWASWAIADPTCRSSLYERCDEDSHLHCSWLDEYFSANSTSKNFIRPHEDAIEAYLYNDCPPSPPCACSGLQFNTKDDPTQAFQCCKALKVHAHVPFSGLALSDVTAYCDGNTGRAASRVSGWVAHQLWHTVCPASGSSVYSFRPVKEEVVTKEQDTSSSSGVSTTTPSFVAVRQHQPKEDNTMGAVLVGALVGAGLAVAVAASVIVYSSTRRGYASLV